MAVGRVVKGGPAINIFEEEYEKRFGVAPSIQTPDAVALNRALKTAGDDYRELVAYYLAKEDRFLEAHGWSGRMLSAPIINAWRISKVKNRPRQTTGPSYKDKLAQWEMENGLAEMPSLAPLPGARTNG